MKTMTKNPSESPKTSSKVGQEIEVTASVSPDLSTVSEWNIEGTVLENMRLLVTRIQKGEKIPKKLSIFSALNGEGSTSVCLGLGVTLANDYKVKICIVDLNWHKPSPFLKTTANEPGIIDIISGRSTIDKVLKPVGESSLFIFPAGNIEESQRPALAHSRALADLIDEVCERFDYVIMDIPAILSTSDSIQLAALGDGCVMVVQQGVTPIRDVKLALDEVSHLKILGVVINRAHFKTPNALLKILLG